MLEDIKKELLNNPEKIKEVLEHFGFRNIVIRNTYMQFGRDNNPKSSKKSISIKLVNNRFLYVHDYPKAVKKDFFSYIMEEKRVDFTDVLSEVKQALNIVDYYEHFERRGIFGGFYEKIYKRSSGKNFTYDESVLREYQPVCNLKFLKDNISLEAQRYFGIRYDIESQGIVIPIYDQIGQIIGIKERFNYDVEDGEMKYFYSLPCSMSQTLYGYSHNYNFLVNGTVYIFEAEKSVMQCYTYGIRNCVALGSGTISKKQCQMILELNPQKVVFMHDVGYEIESIERNITMLRNYSRFSEMEIWYWDYFNKGYKDKVSPSDMGKKTLEHIIENEIHKIGDDDIEEEL
ncbi:hypothetical protein [Bacteroides sp.]|jgi:hypothetical protein|uniref:hypothetical protein n=1 Tax=Bacteroides sp. TaxID=29523 RepID=UPI0031FDCE9E